MKKQSMMEKFKTRKFYRLDKILSKNALYNVIYGGRNNGKSYAVKEHNLEEAELGKYFGIIFRRKDDKNMSEVVKYFADMPISKITNGKADGIGIRSGEIFFTLDGKKVKTCGYLFYLDQEESYKSGTYNNVYNIIFEEFITTKTYLPGELEKLDSLISTAFRLREGCRVFLIGNTISRVIPYRTGWGLTGIDKQKEDTIDTYKKEFINPYIGEISYITIAVERTKSEESTTQKFAMSKKGQQVAGGDWQTSDCMTISNEERSKAEEIYSFVVTFSGYYFLIRLYNTLDGQIFLYCERKTTRIQPNTRVIGDILSMDIRYTKRFTPLVDKERILFNLLSENKMYYCDSLTAADFEVVYNSILRS